MDLDQASKAGKHLLIKQDMDQPTLTKIISLLRWLALPLLIIYTIIAFWRDDFTEDGA